MPWVAMVLTLFFTPPLLSESLAAEVRPSRGTALMNACAACHGPDGHSQGAIPSIHTLPKEQLVDSLRAFRSGARQGTVMNRIAKGLSDDDITALAAHAAR
ncbi:MAG: c-type cytochrome [Deltaproteobacteria bacterium]|nr:c-type cytochrome [Deltaproteobacteria bacterium]